MEPHETDPADLWDEDETTTEALLAQVSDVSQRLEGELERDDYVSARISADRLNWLCGALNDPIDDATDPAGRNPLVDVYEAASELRIRANAILQTAAASVKPSEGRD